MQIFQSSNKNHKCFRNVLRSVKNHHFTDAVMVIVISWPLQYPIREEIHKACVYCLQMKNVVGGVLYCSLRRAEGEPRCWSVFTASVERKGGRARADDLEGVQRQGPCMGDLHSLPQGDTATAYLFLHFYFFFILFHSTAFISLSSQFRRMSTRALFPTQRQPLC